MKTGKFWFAVTGVALLAFGFFLQNLQPYRPASVVSSEASCRMRVDVIEPVSGTPQGYVVLFHGLSANHRIMSYLAQDMANQDLRVFAPDFPGHGRTPGPFSPQRASQCGEAFVRELIDRRAILPEKTLLVGHSMGGAIAIQTSGKIAVAGVVAISPAPTGNVKGIPAGANFFPDPAPLAKNSLVLRGSLEPKTLREVAEANVTAANDPTSKYMEIRGATHVSLLFNRDVFRAIRLWSKKVMGTEPDVAQSSRRPFAGFLIGLAGLILICVPFVAEIAGGSGKETPDPAPRVLPSRALLQVIVASLAAVVFLKFWVPLKAVGIFQGDYLASFALVAGLILLAWNWSALTKAWTLSWRNAVAVTIGAIALILLFSLWIDFGFYEAWLNAPRWARILPMLLAFFPWLLAEELFLGSYANLSRVRRLIFTLFLRAIAWGVMAAAIYMLHSGEVLMVLLVVYFILVSVFQRLAMDVVRRETHSAAAAALFGAILSAGFALAIFPLV